MGTQFPLTQKGTAPSPIFGPYPLRLNGCIDQDATWYGGRPRPRRLCVRWGPRFPPQKGERSPLPKFSAHVYCGQTAGWIKIVFGMEVGLSRDDLVVLDGDLAPSPIFGPCLLWPNGTGPPSNTMSLGSRSTFLPSGILIYRAILQQQIWAENWRGCAPLGEGDLGPHLPQCGQERGLPTCMPNFILIRPTVWPQYTNVTDRQDRQTNRQTDRQTGQRSDSIGRTVLLTVAPKPSLSLTSQYFQMVLSVARFLCDS